MIQAILTHTPSRRALLAGLSAALASSAFAATAGAMPAGNPDAKLIRLCEKYHFHRSAFLGHPDPIDEDAERQMDIDYAGYWGAVDAMTVIPALTYKGLAAKAGVVKRAIPDSDNTYHDLALSLAEDCVRLGGLES